MITHCQPVRILLRSPSHAIRRALTAVLVLAALAGTAHAGRTLLESSGAPQSYVLQVSGTVLHEAFSGATMTLQLSGATYGGQSSYLVIAHGYPDSQTRNAFFWNSDFSAMDVSSNTITCTIRPGSSSPNICFYYISPKLLKRPQVTHKDKEDDQRALKTAVPTVVPAEAGELNLTINPNSVSGTVWLQGYDTIERSYVRYSASFSGMRMTHVEQKTQRTYR
jgi:hypothetical protein